MEHAGLVSIITVSYNSERTISRTIESVLKQTYPNFEYTIIDGASTDSTVAIAKGYLEQFQERGIRFCILSDKDNGMYNAINKGIAVSRGIIIGNVNSDDWYEADAIEKIIMKFQAGEYDVVYGNLRVHKKSGIFIKKAKINNIASTRYWNHPTMFVKRSIYEKHQYRCCNMYDDLDLMLRLRKAGYKFGVVDSIISNFSFGGMSTKKNFKEMMKRVHTRYAVYRRNGYTKLYWLDSILIELLKYILA